jgi:hypothetical protein
MTPEQIDSALLAAHNIARAFGTFVALFGYVAFALFVYPWLGGFASGRKDGGTPKV